MARNSRLQLRVGASEEATLAIAAQRWPSSADKQTELLRLVMDEWRIHQASGQLERIEGKIDKILEEVSR